MVKIKIAGIPMDLPYPPYPAQLVTISKMVGAFQSNGCALIESPTGTGKSLSIICAAQGYLQFTKRDIARDDTQHIKHDALNSAASNGAIQSENPNGFKIYICSRTHKQLDQLVDQLRKTSYRPRITILGSKNHYCINPKLRDIVDKNTACMDLIKTNQCIYHSGKDRLIKKIGDKLFDIEELRSTGKKCVGCPYFAAREMCEEAEIIFAPYNYLIDPKIRNTMNLELSNAIVIIDEAHNIEDSCRSAGSLELTSKLIDIISNEIIGAVKKSALLGEIKSEFIVLLEFFRKFREYSEKVEMDSKNFEFQLRIKTGKEIIVELEAMGITKEVFLQFRNSHDKIIGHDDAKTLISLNTGQVLEEILLIFNMLLFGSTDSYGYCFKRFNTEYVQYSLNFWLLDPAVIFNQLSSKVKTICLLSGTMTPFASFIGELGHSFEHKIVAPHILKSEQVFIANINSGHLNKELCGTYAIAETFEYLDQIARIIKNVGNSIGVSGGVLVFVPSYTFLKKLASRLKSDALVEPQSGGMAEFEKVLGKYKTRIGKQCAIMLCVYRGKASEGIDFKDNFARAVIAVGIPYPSVKDPQISLKREFNNLNGRYNGHAWYQAQTFRAVNQALGRVVRHKKDWGAVFLLDSRYRQKYVLNSLSAWVTSNTKDYHQYTDCINDFNAFLSSKNKNNEDMVIINE